MVAFQSRRNKGSSDSLSWSSVPEGRNVYRTAEPPPTLKLRRSEMSGQCGHIALLRS